MTIIKDRHNEWSHKGHTYGECMSRPGLDLMYVYIPKNASSWTKPNLLDHGWQFYNYHADTLHKPALVVLRDPVDRWLSGIAEYFTLYHPNFVFSDRETVELIFDRVTFDDHTEQQVKFLTGLNTDCCTFIMCDTDYKQNFSTFMIDYVGNNKYNRYEHQHVSETSPERKRFKEIFSHYLANPKYLNSIKEHFAADYQLIEQVKFYGTR